MAAIRRVVLQNGKVRYRVRVRRNGRYRSSSHPNKVEAQRWADRIEREFCLDRQSPLGRSEVITLGELVRRYEESVLSWKKPRTQRQQAQQLRWWMKHLGEHTPLVQISSDAVSEAKNALRPRSAKTINRYLAVFSHMMTKAVKEFRCLENEAHPVRDVSRLPEGEARSRWLNPDERKRLLYACSTSHCRMLYTLVVVALSTGARKEEIRRMKWEHLDLWRTMSVDGGTVEVGRYFLTETKTDEARALILFGESLSLLRKLYRQRRPGNSWCFPSEREPDQPLDFRYAWEKALEKADIANFCFHDLRHSAASYLGEQGANLFQIGAILGHKNPATTKKYTHFTHSGMEGIVAKMNGSIFKSHAERTK